MMRTPSDRKQVPTRTISISSTASASCPTLDTGQVRWRSLSGTRTASRTVVLIRVAHRRPRGSWRRIRIDTATTKKKWKMHAAGSPTNAIGSIRSMRGTSLSSSSLVATPRGRRNLQVVAGKKGKQSGRVMPGRMTGPQKQMSLPPLDPEDPQFVLFVRSKRLPQWFPFSVVSGGSQAKLLTKAMENDLGKKMYANTLTKNIAGVVYKDISNIKQAVYAQYPRLKEAKELEFGYKIRKEESLQGTFGASGIVAIPPQEELKGVVDKVKDFFSGLS